MFKFILFILYSLPGFGQIEVTFKPHNDLKDIIGKHTKYTIWTVAISNNSPTSQTISRERIMRLAPTILEIPGSAAQDLLTRAAYKDRRNLMVRILDGSTTTISTGITTYGLLKKQNIAIGIGLGLALTKLFRADFVSRAPSPQPYFGDLLPKEVVLGSLGSVTYAVLASFEALPQTIEAKLPQ